MLKKESTLRGISREEKIIGEVGEVKKSIQNHEVSFGKVLSEKVRVEVSDGKGKQ